MLLLFPSTVIFTNYFPMNYLNILLLPVFESFKWLLSRRLLHQNSVRVSSLSYLSYMYVPLPPHLFHYSNTVSYKHSRLLLKFSCQQWYMSYRFADRLLSTNLYDIYHCCVYSEKLLKVDRGTVQNM